MMIPGQIEAKDLVIGGLYVSFLKGQLVQIVTIEGDMIHWRDDLGASRSDRDSFLLSFPWLAPPNSILPEQSDYASLAPVPKDFTNRDEANTLTALAFRNGFIEELHAGKWSPLLEDPKNSRITDAEMRRLMIEASEQLARMLRFKQSKPVEYAAWLLNYNDMYCRGWKRE